MTDNEFLAFRGARRVRAMALRHEIYQTVFRKVRLLNQRLWWASVPPTLLSFLFPFFSFSFLFFSFSFLFFFLSFLFLFSFFFFLFSCSLLLHFLLMTLTLFFSCVVVWLVAGVGAVFPEDVPSNQEPGSHIW